jgi:DNA modification methylase
LKRITKYCSTQNAQKMQEINKMYCENCLETMVKMADNSVDSIVTDPPYGLKFMGKKWDCEVPGVAIWEEALRVLKPGGYLIAFAGTRTQHRMAVNIEDAGFEIRDMIAWVYGSGFPKSHDISKALDKSAGAEREVTGQRIQQDIRGNKYNDAKGLKMVYNETIPATESPILWQGWGTALKPALEPITVARKPFSGTVAANVLQYGTGGINIDGCRVGERTKNESGWSKTGAKASENRAMSGRNYHREAKDEIGMGRFPANLIIDGSEEVMAFFPETTSGTKKVTDKASVDENGHKVSSVYGKYNPLPQDIEGSRGSAARFFYTAKASKSERGKGNDHPTVKPLDLMRYLVRLVTPPKGLVYDPFAGSGTTLIAAIEEGFGAIGSDLDQHHCDIFNLRTRHGIQPKMF